MAEKITYRFLPEDKCLTERQLFDYIDKKLNAADMHLIEKHLLACEMCSDALEGFEKIKNREKVAAFFPATNFNQKDQETKETRVIPLHPNRKYYAIAAGVILILGVSLFLKMNVSGNMESPKTADLVSKDSSVGILESPKESGKISADSVSNGVTISREESGTASGPVVANKRADYSGKFGYFDTTKNADGEDGALAGVKPEDQLSLQQNVTPVPDAIEDRSLVAVTDEADKQESDQKQDKDLSKVEQKKALSEITSDDATVDSKTKAPAKNDDYRFENNRDKDKVAAEKANEKETAHTTLDSAPAQPKTTPASGNVGTAAPSYAGGSTNGNADGNGAVNTVTDSETTVTSQSDSISVNTGRLFPLAASDKDLDQSYETGVKMLDSGKATASIAFFDQVLTNPSHHYFQDAQWKKALALIQLKRNAEAKTLLQEIITKGGKYKSQAEAELKKL